ncbi:UNVERIFIED_CONTAM: hypothetical protein K2H54_057121 [Gekko kuhli]
MCLLDAEDFSVKLPTPQVDSPEFDYPNQYNLWTSFKTGSFHKLSIFEQTLQRAIYLQWLVMDCKTGIYILLIQCHAVILSYVLICTMNKENIYGEILKNLVCMCI